MILPNTRRTSIPISSSTLRHSEENLHPIIEAKDLRKTFGGFVAVDGITFRMPPGECLGLLGPNGAGKTTTIRMVYGFSPITEGSLRVFGLDIRTDWRTIKARIGVCQQENNPDPDLSLIDNLVVFARYFDIPRKEALERAQTLLRFMGLDHRRDSKVTELSGGMMRRLILARSLLNNPDLLILDEPTTGLDPQSRHQVWDRLEDLRSNGLSILLTTHYMDEAARLCDRLIILDHGKILVEGSPSQLIAEHVGRDVIEWIHPSPDIRRLVLSSGFEYDDLDHRLIVYGKEGEGLFDRVGKAYCSEECIFRMATLEDVFLRLTGRELRE
ncbi:MAG: ATP-binding cassette domain-containing protein [Syntrophobacteraceae bacterium]|nr:ATP-binding cassette domain-containing protein [Syntrophobacteraceae bacterium]